MSRTSKADAPVTLDEPGIEGRYAGHDEACTAGDACYGAPGHLPPLFAGTELAEFSPAAALNSAMAAAGRSLQAARA